MTLTIPKNNIFISIPHLFLFLFFPSSSISLSSILSCFYLYSVFHTPFLSFPLSHFPTSISHVLNCLSLLIAHSAPSFLSFHTIPVFSPHFSFSCILCHTPLILPVVSGFFDSFPSFLLGCVFVPLTQLYIYLSSFCS
jgi:hypothetical protein